MSAWIRAEATFGLPMKRIQLSNKLLRMVGINTYDIFRDPKEHALFITLLLEEATMIPRNSYLVAIHYSFTIDALELTFINKEFPPVEDGCIIPIDDQPNVTHEKFNAAVNAMRSAVTTMKQIQDSPEREEVQT